MKGQWVEDAGYAAQLDEDWHLEDVREATYAALAAVGRDNMHFRPPDEQNEHKVRLGHTCKEVRRYGPASSAIFPRSFCEVGDCILSSLDNPNVSVYVRCFHAITVPPSCCLLNQLAPGTTALVSGAVMDLP